MDESGIIGAMIPLVVSAAAVVAVAALWAVVALAKAAFGHINDVVRESNDVLAKVLEHSDSPAPAPAPAPAPELLDAAVIQRAIAAGRAQRSAPTRDDAPEYFSDPFENNFDMGGTGTGGVLPFAGGTGWVDVIEDTRRAG